MVKHIVMILLKETEPAGKRNLHALELKKQLESLKKTVPELLKLEVGLNFNKRPSAYDLVLITEFNSEEDLDKYRNHPAHVEVLKFLKEVTEKTAVVDYEING